MHSRDSVSVKCDAASANECSCEPHSGLCPEIEPQHFEWAPPGVRAQAVSPDGEMVDDFVINETDRVVNVENAPSPAATASLNIGRLVVDRLVPRFA
jgi:(S)-2-hydroxyglutarate dehydrogenase